MTCLLGNGELSDNTASPDAAAVVVLAVACDPGPVVVARAAVMPVVALVAVVAAAVAVAVAVVAVAAGVRL